MSGEDFVPTVLGARGGAVHVAVYSVTLQELNLLAFGGDAGRPLYHDRQQNGRLQVTYVSHNGHSCVRMCVCVCV